MEVSAQAIIIPFETEACSKDMNLDQGGPESGWACTRGGLRVGLAVGSGRVRVGGCAVLVTSPIYIMRGLLRLGTQRCHVQPAVHIPKGRKGILSASQLSNVSGSSPRPRTLPCQERHHRPHSRWFGDWCVGIFHPCSETRGLFGC